jgi:hypothetical protein
MSLRTARALTAAYLILAMVFVVWPGFVPFARVRPLVLGLPFSMAWIASWVAGTAVVLALLDRVERKHRAATGAPATGGDA